MREPHPDVALVSYLRGELEPAERRRVEAHLADCRECQEAASDFDAILERLTATAPPVPEPHWGRYRAEVRARREVPAPHGRRGFGGPQLWGPHVQWSRWRRPLPVAMAAAAAAVVLLTLTLGPRGAGPNGDVATLEEAGLAGRLDLLDKRAIVERLDLLEDLEVIHDLDRLAATREG